MKNVKLEMVKAMHSIICRMNNEDAYMSWINLVPDEATEDDFVDLAENDMEEVSNLFRRILAHYGKDGWYLQEGKTGNVYGGGKI